jgi:hypothetical protein
MPATPIFEVDAGRNLFEFSKIFPQCLLSKFFINALQEKLRVHCESRQTPQSKTNQHAFDEHRHHDEKDSRL